MASYITITDAETDPEAPLTSELAKKWRDNPIAIAEGAAGAPKIVTRKFTSGAAAQTQTFTGLGDYGGVDFQLFARNTGAATYDLQFQFSSNGGSSWSTARLINSVGSGTGSNYMSLSGHFDFATGLLSIIGNDGIQPFRMSATLSGASLSIDAIRFTSTNLALTNVCIITPNGGTV